MQRGGVGSTARMRRAEGLAGCVAAAVCSLRSHGSLQGTPIPLTVRGGADLGLGCYTVSRRRVNSDVSQWP